MLKFLLIVIILFAAYIALRIYWFFKATNAPILQGELKCSISYKEGHKLDIYLPTNEVYDKAPVLIFFHGGAWVIGSRKAVNNARFNGAFNKLREKGYAIVSPTYTLAKRGKSPFPACLQDAADALNWIEENAEEYNFDLDNIGILGESAGAHIGLMASYASSTDFYTGHNVSIRYMIDVYGPTHLHKLFLDLEPLLAGISERVKRLPSLLQGHFDLPKKLFGFDPKSDRDRAIQFTKQFSPYDFLHQGAPSTLIIHGDNDRLVPISQSYLLKEKLIALNVFHKIYILQGVGHAFRGATPKQRYMTQEWIVDFVYDHYQFTSDEYISTGTKENLKLENLL